MTSEAHQGEKDEGSPRTESLLALGWLSLVAIYSLLVLTIDAMSFESQVDGALMTLVGIAWITILVVYWRGLARATSRRSYALTHLGVPLLLVTPILAALPTDTSWLPLFVLLTAYVLELRGLAAGHGFLFSLGLVTFVIVLATGVMAFVEREEPESPLSDVPTSAAWALATLFRLRAPYGEPQTEDGKTLALVVGVCALIAASLFTAQLVTWVTGSGRDRERISESTDELIAEIAALRAAVEKLTNERGRDGASDDSSAADDGSKQEPKPH